MSNKVINTISYTGIVTLSQYVGPKKVKIAQMHNTGGTSLFNFLANCLAGDFISAKASLPKKIKFILQTRTAENTFEYTSCSSFIFLRTPPEPSFDAGQSKVRFSFIIPRDFLSNNYKTDSSNKLGLGLYADNIDEGDEHTSNFMAFCALDNLEASALTNAFFVVDWELIISNTSSTSGKQNN